MKKYLYVLDRQIAQTLISEGNRPLNVVGTNTATVWVFENTGCFNFSNEDTKGKIHYSDTLRMCF